MPLSSSQVETMKRLFPELLEQELLQKHTNLRIGGPARLFATVTHADQLMDLLLAAKEKGIPWFILGGGSNLLVSDEGFEGLVVNVAFREVTIRNQIVLADAGALMTMVSRQAAESALTGLEWAMSLPGTVGGAIYGNSGCWGGETGDFVVSVDALRLSDLTRQVYPKKECHFAYRESRFKQEPHLILRAMFGLQKGDASEIRSRMDEVLALRKEKQPLEQSSAGCMFKNYAYKNASALEKLERDGVEIPEEMRKKKVLSAGWLVDQAGMRGEKIGDAQVSDKHANFLVNTGHARAQDVLMLMSKIKMKVRDQYDIMLEDEVQLIGF